MFLLRLVSDPRPLYIHMDKQDEQDWEVALSSAQAECILAGAISHRQHLCLRSWHERDQSRVAQKEISQFRRPADRIDRGEAYLRQ